jgi:putative polyketide hydroxylase
MIDDEIVPVLIVGGGPVGLSCAVFLCRYGVHPLLVERHRGTSIHPRARGLNYRTMEIFRREGLEQAVRIRGSALAGVRWFLVVETLAGRELQRFRVKLGEQDEAYQLSPTRRCMCAQDELEPVLLDAASERGAQINFNTELTEFEVHPDCVTAKLTERDTGQLRTVRARYVVAADGANSPMRTALSIGTSGPGILGHNFGIYFRADLSDLIQERLFGMALIRAPRAEGTLTSVNNTDRWVFTVRGDPEKGECIEYFSPERCVALVRSAIGIPDLDVQILSTLPWEPSGRVAQRFRSGCIFLAGDAAHTMPPTGGFGLNAGVQDAHNLAWKLAYVLRGLAGTELLDTYDEERRPVGAVAVDQAVDRLRHMPDTPARITRGIAPANVSDDAEVVLGHAYRSRAVIAEDTRGTALRDGRPWGLPGTRAPHVTIGQDGARTSTVDLLGPNFVLFASNSAWLEGGAAAGSQLGVPISGCWPLRGDCDSEWAAAFGVSEDGVVLVRPDGFVAWRSSQAVADPESELARVLRRVLCRAG